MLMKNIFGRPVDGWATTGRRAPANRCAAVLVVVAAAVGLFLLASSTAAAQSTPTPEQINAVAKDLWCPLCNGVRLDNCELQACVQMREEISQKLAAGQSKDQIKAYFVQRYGEVVLGMPSGQGFNFVAWGCRSCWQLSGLAGLATLSWCGHAVAPRRRGPQHRGLLPRPLK